MRRKHREEKEWGNPNMKQRERGETRKKG
ncbi:uncharacterized protein G2W53_015867 [Senna tora]|uniref:Uncharacterized protein n=1 Tax=Senna tora TaxID=362788 RepID=A0A835C6B6_9FABA|nr:uncharacterized protein G2W53_015867 [Senna tora]